MNRHPASFRRAWSTLRRAGLLLESDRRLPSVVGLVARAPQHGSWWSHPQGREIFRVLDLLADRPDVTVTKLVAGKVTFVHRRLWPALVRVGMERAAWQLEGLSSGARELLALVGRRGELRTDRPLPLKGIAPRRVGDLVRELETRLLVASAQFHTESGAHAKRLESWPHWAKRQRVRVGELSLEKAQAQIEQALRRLDPQASPAKLLPWPVA